jgi:hypothetical protein
VVKPRVQYTCDKMPTSAYSAFAVVIVRLKLLAQLLAIRLQLRSVGASQSALNRTKHVKGSEHEQGR